MVHRMAQADRQPRRTPKATKMPVDSEVKIAAYVRRFGELTSSQTNVSFELISLSVAVAGVIVKWLTVTLARRGELDPFSG